MGAKSCTIAASSRPPTLDADEFDELLGEFYEAATDLQRWHQALGTVRTLFRANLVSLILRPPTLEDRGLTVVVSETAVEFYSADDFRSSPFTGIRTDSVFAIEDIMGLREWRHHVYYQTWCAPYQMFHVLAADIRTPDSAIFPLRITRPEGVGAFHSEDKRLLQRLLPHIRRALAFSIQFDRSEILHTMYGQALNRLAVATIVLDNTGRVLQLNQSAKRMLTESDSLYLADGRLEAHYAGDNKVMQAAIRKAVLAHGQLNFSETLSLARRSGKMDLGVILQSAPTVRCSTGEKCPAVIIFIRDTELSPQVPYRSVQQLFNLTRAETMLAMELANGLSLGEAAEKLNISRNTARAQLRAIFSKTGVRRQAELLRLVLNSVAALGHGNDKNDPS